MDTVRPILERAADVRFAYLFGSVAKERACAASDIDIAVWLEETDDPQRDGVDPSDRALGIEGVLERALTRRVQVVVLNTAPTDLAHNVLRHGRLILGRDDPLRRRFYVDHARRYYDMASARALFGHSMRRRIEEGRFGGGARHRT